MKKFIMQKINRFQKKGSLVKALVFIGLASLFGCKPDETEIKIGQFSALTGGNAVQGTAVANGVTLAIEEANAAGGVLGKKIKLITEDNQSKSSESATVVTKLINSENVVAVIGESASSRTLAAAPIAQQNKIPLVTPVSTNERVTQVGDYIFRVCFIDPFQGTVMAKFTANTLKVKKVALLKDVKSDYSVGLTDAFVKTFTALGGEIVGTQAYNTGDKDFKAQLTSLKAKNPEVIFVPGYYAEVSLIARQARELGITVPLAGGDAWDANSLIPVAGNTLEGSYFSSHVSFEDTSKVIQDFLAKYKQRFGSLPESVNAVLGYDAGKIVVEAIKNSKTAKPEDIRNELAKTQNFKGVSGNITIDANRNATKPAVVLQIKGDKFVYVATVNP
jgi:branched-chain amino acid transport system substrate-binding protein